MINTRIRIISLAVLVLLTGHLAAPIAAQDEHPDPLRVEPDPDRFPEPEPWREPGFDTPEYPRDKDLLRVPVEPNSTFKMYVDRTSVQVKGQVTQLVYVLESKSGAKNVLAEGFRCTNYHYTTYAIGGTDGVLRPVKNRSWVPVDRNTGRNNFRLTWMSRYLCDFFHKNRPRREVLQLVRVPTSTPDAEDL